MKVYQLGILTPEKKIYSDTVVSITVSGENGQLTVLAGHCYGNHGVIIYLLLRSQNS